MEVDEIKLEEACLCELLVGYALLTKFRGKPLRSANKVQMSNSQPPDFLLLTIADIQFDAKNFFQQVLISSYLLFARVSES